MNSRPVILHVTDADRFFYSSFFKPQPVWLHSLPRAVAQLDEKQTAVLNTTSVAEISADPSENAQPELTPSNALHIVPSTVSLADSTELPGGNSPTEALLNEATDLVRLTITGRNGNLSVEINEMSESDMSQADDTSPIPSPLASENSPPAKKLNRHRFVPTQVVTRGFLSTNRDTQENKEDKRDFCVML